MSNDNSVVWIEQTSDGVDLSGAAPETVPTSPDPRRRVYPASVDAGLFDWGYENRHLDPARPVNDPTRTRDQRQFFALQELVFHSAAPFDALVYMTDGTTDILVIDTSAIFGAPINDMVVTRQDLPTLLPGHKLKCLTVGAAANVNVRAAALRQIP